MQHTSKASTTTKRSPKIKQCSLLSSTKFQQRLMGCWHGSLEQVIWLTEHSAVPQVHPGESKLFFNFGFNPFILPIYFCVTMGFMH